MKARGKSGRRARVLRSMPAWAMLAFVLQAAPQSARAGTFDATLPVPPEVSDTGGGITIHVREAALPILPGAPTTMWTFDGMFPGPTIRATSGQETNVTFVNDLPAAGPLTIHRHGGHNACEDDGQPMDGHACRPGAAPNYLIAPGSQRTYRYGMEENGEKERGALEWYHDHTMDATSRNVWMGLAGMFIVDDGFEAAHGLNLPSGESDVPLMITDRSFDMNNQLVPVKVASDPAFDSNGAFGDKTLVNGALTPHFDVADRMYRFRILNASNDRSYDLALSDGTPMLQIGTESGLMPFGVSRSHIPLGPAERAEVILNFAGLSPGSSVVLKNLKGYGGMANVMEFRVNRHETETAALPANNMYRELPGTVDLSQNKPVRTRTWILGQEPLSQPAVWTINGKTFDHMRVDAFPKLGTTELWAFVNSTQIDHLIHVHDVDWRLVARFGPNSGTSTIGLDPVCPSAFGTPAGESCALKETFRVGSEETIVIASTFTDNVGTYMFHCHLLAHEDRAMMGQFEVVARGGPYSAPHHHSS